MEPGAQLGYPSSFDPSIYNDCLTILTRQVEAIEDTCVPDCLSVPGFAPAIEIIGRTSGKIFNRRYTVFTKGDEHLVGYTWNVLETVFNTKFFWFRIKCRLRAL